jgi:small subunit ribosomal protein S1
MTVPEDEGGESFAAMFEAEAKTKPRRGGVRRLAVGEPVEATVVRVGRDTVFVELDGKREGWIEAHELRNAEGKVELVVGDVIRAMVVDASEEDGAVRLGKAAPKGRGAEGLIAAMEAGLTVEGLVSGVNKGGLEVTIDGTRAFCPARQADNRFVADLAPLIGQKLQFLVTAVKEGGREVVLSRRALLDREAGEARAKIADKLVAGAVLRGRVTSTREFGAFVDIGGVEGLLPASELSHDRSMRPDDVVKVGQEIDVQVLEIQPDPKKPGQQKITLSLKALAGDPWETVASTLTENSVREGRVVRIAPFGAFVQLHPGLDGLLHVSELSGEVDAQGAATLPKVGDNVMVKILKVDLEQRRIALAPAEGGGATARKQAAQAMQPGTLVKGKISGVERFGIFVQIEGAGLRGLVPAQELTKTRGEDLHKHFTVGQPIEAKIVSIDASGKVRLSIKAMHEDQERATFEDYRQKEHDRSASPMGALGQKLAQAGIVSGKATKGKKK